ncbi:MAG: hypothetical protein AAF703_06110 [Cyanobacteria bacterium P01_D01_bin.105]
MSLSADSGSALKQMSAYRKTLWRERGRLVPIPPGSGLILWLGWTSLTWLAFLVSLAVIEVGERGDISFVDGLLGGGLVGFAQWLMLRSHVQRSHRWIWLSALYWGALSLLHIGALGWTAPNTPSLTVRVGAGLFYGFYVGLTLGVGQWWVMRNSLIRAWRWALLSAGIWSVSMAFGWLVGGGLRSVSHLFVAEVFGLIIAWGMMAILSGIAIIGMVYQQDHGREHDSG